MQVKDFSWVYVFVTHLTKDTENPHEQYGHSYFPSFIMLQEVPADCLTSPWIWVCFAVAQSELHEATDPKQRKHFG